MHRILPEPLVRAAREAYASPGRHYHTWDHVLACFRAFREFQESSTTPESVRHPDEVAFALLFHDAVYVPGRKDNEERSADLAGLLLRNEMALDEDAIERVREMIRLTREHRAERPLSPDEQLVLDVDLSILGRPWREYRRYMVGVRREYCPAVVRKPLYRAGRRAFLRALVREPVLFRTRFFRSRFDGTARANIQREIALLRPRGSAARALDLLWMLKQRLR